MEALRRSADENDGTPNISAVSREIGLSRKALRTWWKKRQIEHRGPPLAHPPPPLAHPSPTVAHPPPPPLPNQPTPPHSTRPGYSVRLDFTEREAGYVCAPRSTAVEAIGTISPGFRLEVVNRGNFGRIDIVQALLTQTGPADVLLSTWSIGIRDGANLAQMQSDGLIRSMSLVVNLANKTVEPHKTYWERMVGWFGESNVYPCQVHSKFTVIRNENWNIVIRSSANLTENIRLEQFSIDDSAAMANFYAGIIRSWAACVPEGFETPTKIITRAMKGALVDVESTPAPNLQLLSNPAHSTSLNPAHPTSLKPAHPTSLKPAHLYDMSEVGFLEAQAINASRLLAAAERDRSYVAAGKFFVLQKELYEALQVARQSAADASALDEAAFIERMEENAAEMPDPHLEIYVREYLDRHNLQLGPRTGTGG